MTKRFPSCFGHFRERDSVCNGNRYEGACLARTRCLGLRQLLSERCEETSAHLILDGAFSYPKERTLLVEIDSTCARLGIKGGSVRYGRARKRRLELLPPYSGHDIWAWFLASLGRESGRSIRDGGFGQADIGELYTQHLSGSCRLGGRVSIDAVAVLLRVWIRPTYLAVSFDHTAVWQYFSEEERSKFAPYRGRERSAKLEREIGQAGLISRRVAEAIEACEILPLAWTSE